MRKALTVALLGLLCPFLSGPLFAQEDRPQAKDSLGNMASEEELDQVKEALNGLSESFTEYRNYVDALRKIKISGYLQPQWRGGDVIDQRFTIGGFSGGGFPANTKSAFQVRRAG